MWWFALLLFVAVGGVCVVVPWCQKKYVCVKWVGLLWTLSIVVWYAFNPLFDGPPRILKSVERNITHGTTLHNWGNTDKCHPHTFVRAKHEEDVRAAMVHDHVRVAGAGHSWTPLICSDDTVLFLDYCNITLENDVATADAGCSIEETHAYLYPRVLHGFGGIQYQTLGGAVMTSLHGSQFHSFASQVLAMRVMFANGTASWVDGNELTYWKHSMGMLGVVLQLRMRTHKVQSVQVTQRVVTLEESMAAVHNNSLEGLIIDALWGKYNTRVALITFSDPKEETLPYDAHHSNWFAFLFDNVLMPVQILVPHLLSLFDAVPIMFDEYTTRKSILDAWDTHMGHGYISAEYSVPLDKCYSAIAAVRTLANGRPISLYVRKLFADPDPVAGAAGDACIV